MHTYTYCVTHSPSRPPWNFTRILWSKYFSMSTTFWFFDWTNTRTEAATLVQECNASLTDTHSLTHSLSYTHSHTHMHRCTYHFRDSWTQTRLSDTSELSNQRKERQKFSIIVGLSLLHSLTRSLTKKIAPPRNGRHWRFLQYPPIHSTVIPIISPFNHILSICWSTINKYTLQISKGFTDKYS
jgi:hypothetical protein